MKHLSKLTLATLSVLALPTVGHTGILVHGGFEVDNIKPLSDIVSPTFDAGFWGVENAARDMGPSSGIMPYKGDWMLKMDDDGLLYTQALQFVDISLRGSMDTLELEAWYNSAASSAEVVLNVRYYDGDNSWGSPLSIDGRAMILDNNVSTWQGLYFQSAIPVAANWVGVEIAFRNATIGTDSGFVDGVSAGLVPEPTSMIAIGVGLAALAARRRRRK